MRFKDLTVGQHFRIHFGGCLVTAEKTELGKMRIQKLNSPGFIDVPVNPELNEDDVTPVEEPKAQWLSGQEFKASGEVRTLEVHVVGLTQSGKSAISLLLANLLSRAGVDVELDPNTKEDLRCEANGMAYPLSEEKLIAYLKNQTASEGKVRICQFYKLQPAVGLVNKEEPGITG